MNIDAVSGGTTSSVWNAAANGSGAWMDISVLTAGGTDTILAANAQTAIAINITIDIGTGRLSTAAEGGSAGGGFTVAAARTITGNILAGTTECIVPSGSGYTLTVVGNATGGAANARGIANTVAVNLDITGDVTGGTGTNSWGIRSTSTGTITVVGNIAGGSGVGAHGIYQSGTGTLNVTGNVSAGTNRNTQGIHASDNIAQVTITSGNLINTTDSVALSGKIIYNPGAGNYIQYPKTDGGAGTYDYGKVTGQEANIKTGVAIGSVTGTYDAAAMPHILTPVMANQIPIF